MTWKIEANYRDGDTITLPFDLDDYRQAKDMAAFLATFDKDQLRSVVILSPEGGAQVYWRKLQ